MASVALLDCQNKSLICWLQNCPRTSLKLHLPQVVKLPKAILNKKKNKKIDLKIDSPKK